MRLDLHVMFVRIYYITLKAFFNNCFSCALYLRKNSPKDWPGPVDSPWSRDSRSRIPSQIAEHIPCPDNDGEFEDSVRLAAADCNLANQLPFFIGPYLLIHFAAGEPAEIPASVNPTLDKPEYVVVTGEALPSATSQITLQAKSPRSPVQNIMYFY